MYNRYVQNDTGTYRQSNTHQNTPPPKHDAHRHKPHENSPHGDTGHRDSASPLGGLFGRDSLFSGILDKFKLSELDTGDLLLLVILFLLFRDGEDEELLIALGLLLIL